VQLRKLHLDAPRLPALDAPQDDLGHQRLQITRAWIETAQIFVAFSAKIPPRDPQAQRAENRTAKK